MRKILSIFLPILIIICLGLIVFINRGWFVKKEKQPDLEGFYKLTQEDPLFYSPFFDQEKFQRAIEDLRKTEDDLKDVLIKYSKEEIDAKIYKDNLLFPYQFLKDLSTINQTTKEFLKNPSIELGQKLLELYDNAADSYIQNISSKITLMESFKINMPTFYFFTGSVSSFDVVKGDLLTIKENGYKLKEEVEKRKNCLSGKEDCWALLKIKDNTSFIDSLESGKFDLKGKNVDFIRNNLPAFPLNRVRGPYKIKSSCWQSPDFEHWMYLIYSEQNGKTLISPKLAEQNYYAETDPERKDSVSKAYLKRGIKFQLQPETTYECMDLTFYPQLLVLDFIKEQMESGLASKDDFEKKSEYKLLIENQFGLMTPIIDTIINHLGVLRLMTIVNKNDAVTFPATIILPTRMSYSIFYFPFAKSIWRIDEKLKYFVPEEKKPLMDGSKYVTLSELINLGYTEKQIKEFHIDQWEFLSSLLGKNKP